MTEVIVNPSWTEIIWDVVTWWGVCFLLGGIWVELAKLRQDLKNRP